VASYSGMRIPKELWLSLDTAATLSVPQSATILNCDQRTMRRACAAGQIPATRVGAKWLIPTWWLRQQVKPPAEPPVKAA
jgi:excisionase family DNA binding protein